MSAIAEFIDTLENKIENFYKNEEFRKKSRFKKRINKN
jgi:3-dehydroquinate dehydratase